MNLYVYNIGEMQNALRNVSGFIGKGDPDSIVFKEDAYPWFVLEWDGFFKILYPSGSLWNRKLYELVVPELFPAIKPHKADYFLVPLAIFLGDYQTPKHQLKEFDEKLLSFLCYQLPYWQNNKSKHVFFILGDSYFTPDSLKESIVVRSSCHKGSYDHALYYDVMLDTSYFQPIKECSAVCSFVGCLETHPVRTALPFIISNVNGKTIFESTPNFFAYLHPDNRKRMEAIWTETLNDSQFILAPRGNGLTSIRFFEALAFGRIPILIADDTKLPLEDKIQYDDFIIKVAEKNVVEIPRMIEEFRERDLEAASRLARKTWEDYFSPGKLRAYLQATLPSPIDQRRKILM
jgi:hypothetical protein